MSNPLNVQLAGLDVRHNEPLARYTSARIGGPAQWLVVADSLEVLVRAVRAAQEHDWTWHVLGAGSNVLVADAGVSGLVVINRARDVVFERDQSVYAEAGANLSSLARKCISRGLAGLEWAISVPGTVGGAVVGNAGAHGSDIARDLASATLLALDGAIVEWPVEAFEYDYRDSALKRYAQHERPVVLSALFVLEQGDPAEMSAQAAAYAARRKATQPPGASMGSMFKNPPGDHAGRLIEAVGLKGTHVGGAQISPIHANFFVNSGGATAADVKRLIDLARRQVFERFGVELALEIELLGDWEN
jgi:UDP-N-acetylmuramate dehydrogenase